MVDNLRSPPWRGRRQKGCEAAGQPPDCINGQEAHSNGCLNRVFLVLMQSRTETQRMMLSIYL